MGREDGAIEQNLGVIRQYLQNTISQCHVLDGPSAGGERTLLVKFGKKGQRTVRISTALLSSFRLDAFKLAAVLRKNDIARKVVATPGFYLDPEAVSPKESR